MDKNKSLEYYYSGDEDWNEMVQMAKDDFWIDSDFQIELLEHLKNHKDLAMVTFAKKRNKSLKWVLNKSNILNGLRPVDCIDDEKLNLRLREALMRMPII